MELAREVDELTQLQYNELGCHLSHSSHHIWVQLHFSTKSEFGGISYCVSFFTERRMENWAEAMYVFCRSPRLRFVSWSLVKGFAIQSAWDLWPGSTGQGRYPHTLDNLANSVWSQLFLLPVWQHLHTPPAICTLVGRQCKKATLSFQFPGSRHAHAARPQHRISPCRVWGRVPFWALFLVLTITHFIFF